MQDKRSGLGEVVYSRNSCNIIHPTNLMKHTKHPGLFDKQVPKAGESFHEQVFGKAVTWPGALRTKHTASVPRSMSVFQNRNGSGYAARNNESLTVGRTPCVQDSNSGRREDDEVKLIWEARSTNQTDPTPQLQNLSREESIPGDRALLDIVRSTIKPRKQEIQCNVCSRTFISEKNLAKHFSIYHKPGASCRIPRDKI